MKKFFRSSKKYALVSLLFLLSVFSVAGFTSLNHVSASADVVDIYSVLGANFFDIAADYTISETDIYGNDYSAFYDVTYSSAHNGYRVELLDEFIDDYYGLRFKLNFDDLEGNPLRDLTIGGNYTFIASLSYENSFTEYVSLGLTYSWASSSYPDRTWTYNVLNHDDFRTVDVRQSYIDNGLKSLSFEVGMVDFFEDTFEMSCAFNEGDVFYITDIALFSGSTMYPYRPYYYSTVTDEDYDEGYSDGYNAGYSDGYNEGLSFGQYGLFGFCDCYIQLNYSDLEYERISITDDFYIFGGLDLSRFYPLVSDKSNVSSWYIYFDFTSSRPVSSDLTFSATGYSTVFADNPWFITLKNTPSSKNLDWQSVSTDLTSVSSKDIFRSLTFSPGLVGSYVVMSMQTPYFNDFSYLNGLTISMFNSLYEVGFQQGLNSSDKSSYNSGYAAGYSQGDTDGYNRGYLKGTSDDPYGLADFMFAVLDMPGRILSNWLNFEFMGVNLMGLLALVLSSGIVAFVLKYVL